MPTTRKAARSALDAGRMLVELKDLSVSAGCDMSGEPPPPAQGSGSGEITRETRNIEAAPRAQQGNVTRAARARAPRVNPAGRASAGRRYDSAVFDGERQFRS